MPATTGKDLPQPAKVAPQPAVADAAEKMAALARQINSYLHSNSRELQFQVDAESGDVVITVRNADGRVVRRIPGEEALAMLRRVSVDPGTLIDLTV